MKTIDLSTKLMSAGRSVERRNALTSQFLENPDGLPLLLNLCFEGKSEISGKACRMLEFVCKKNLSLIFPYSEEYASKIGLLEKDAEIRSMGKICELLIIAYYAKKDPATISHLQKPHREKITETCFHWMLSGQKVAAQAHAMTCLQWLGTEFPWIHPELEIILERNYSLKSAGYQARARMVLKKIKP